ncbi:sugar ABC transporter substrate-binding protein [Auraticoccus cholistanensis]|nr:sugar ABC transporter substrate-binding protein [Auraticoccus cholistanensis]
MDTSDARPLRPAGRRTPGRRPARALTVLAALLLTAACQSGGSAEQPPQVSGDEPVTLTFVNAQDPGTFDEVIAGFTEANPNITITLETLPFDDLNSSVQSRLGAKDASIDLYDVDEPRLASFAARGYLADLSDLRAEAEGKIDPKALDATSYQGKQYAMPRWTSTQLLYYNTELLEDAGVEAPSSDPSQPMTWQEVAAAGEQAQQAGAKYGFTFEQVDRYYQLQPLPESLGGGPGLEGEGLLTPAVTNPAWVEAMSWYKSTFDSGLSPRGITAEQTTPLFSDGETAFFAGGPWNAPLFDEAGVDYGVAPFPMFEGGRAVSSTGSWATGVSPFSEKQEAAKAFIRYMTTDATGAWQASSRNLPVQQEAFSRYLSENASDTRSEQLAAIIEHELANNAVARPTTVGFVDFETVMNKAFADIRNGSEPAERLQQAAEELDRALAKYPRE